MKNVMIYNVVNGKKRYDDEKLLKVFRQQIDNSLHFGWEVKDIILGTNFDFEYKGVKSFSLKDICSYNVFNNKWYGMLELVKAGVIDDDFWFHDQDNWQTSQLEFPKFDGQIAACTYIRAPEWNTGSVFVKKTALPVLEYIVDSMKMNELDYSSDEQWISFLRANTAVSKYLAVLNTKYCVGYTYIKDRIQAAEKPISVIACMPNTKAYEALLQENLVPESLQQIFKSE